MSAKTTNDDIGRIKITLAIDDEAPVEDEIDLMPDEDPILVGQRLISRMFRQRDAEAGR